VTIEHFSVDSSDSTAFLVHHTDEGEGEIFANVRHIPIIGKRVDLLISPLQVHNESYGLA
jgi:hypothetical protein